MKNNIKKKALNNILKLKNVSEYDRKNVLDKYNLFTNDDYIEMYEYTNDSYKRLKAEIKFDKLRALENISAIKYKLFEKEINEFLSDEYMHDIPIEVNIGGMDFLYTRDYTKKLNNFKTLLNYFNNILGESYS